ncbi:hypothetical protein EVG20_g2860 [Dentipellis fragilis]|uniref:Nucleoporin Nup120/160-domain-containing protein n=1 Tax=Dentipellis fragilis TaxID=205917 RepID=A0A4Y9Z6P8_9AGAM|nr:hypothetical protein EVG20_g2860 [Dentipellis fragilis]
MADSVIVSSHLSSLYSASHVPTVLVQTARRNTPLPPPRKDSDPPAEHSSYSCVFHSSATGTILLRLLHSGLILELVSLTADASPIRFVFPAPVLPNPAVFLWQSRELHILAATAAGSLYRLVISAQESPLQWHEHLARNWCREYQIKHSQDALSGLVHVQGPHCVAIALENGLLLRLDAEFIGDDFSDDQWTETLFQYSSFFGSITSFLPLQHNSPESSYFVSVASHPQPTDVGHIWTLSRDRTLRLWTARSGCASAKTLPASIAAAREVSPAGGSVPAKPSGLLNADPQKLLTVFSVESQGDASYVLAFIPTPSSTSSGGFFQLFDGSHDTLRLLEAFESSRTSAHCHMQDFTVIGRRLYTLWDKQGQAAVEFVTLPSFGPGASSKNVMTWQIAAYPHEPELTPAYLDELLLGPGSLTDKFFSAIMKPGTFSTLTLRVALEQYTSACLSLPGPPSPQLTTTYATLGENIAAVVGCTVKLVHDQQTGAPQHDKYRTTLKRDWEGFIARCREIERSARWPLALGVGDLQGSDVLVVERERMGAVVGEDLPLRLYSALRANNSVEQQFTLCEAAWTLRSKLGTRINRALEERIIDIVHQEIAFPFADIILDQAQRSLFKDEIDEGLESWITGRLHSLDSTDTATRLTLDLIGGFDREIKREEEEVELLIPQHTSPWVRSLTASYVTFSVKARYEFSLCLITLIFFLSEELPFWDPALLAEVFAVFRGVAMLHYAVEHPTASGTTPAPSDDRGSIEPDDVVARLRNLNVDRSSRGAVPAPAPSLVDRLLTQLGASLTPLPGAAHLFLDSTGLLQATSTAHASKQEMLWCERLRLMRYLDVAREMLEWLPRTPAVMYIRARLWLDVGRDADAADAFDNIAGCFGPNSGLSSDDAEALASVLPSAQLFDSDFSFYKHASSLFKAVALLDYEIHFSRLALSVAPVDWDSSEIWFSVTKGSIELGYYDDAYVAIMTMPYEKVKRECTRQLIARMCEEHAVEKLMSFNFVGITDVVEAHLSFKARNAEPRSRPFYSRILYTWYVSRGDYRNAALVMYQRARKLSTLKIEPSQFVSLAESQLEAYVVAMNSLRLLDQKNAWIVLPITPDSGHSRKRRKLTKNIPEDKFANDKRDSEIVELSDILEEYTLLSARVELIRRDPSILNTSDALLNPSSVVLRLAQANRFTMALSTARILQVDMTDVFAHLTSQCLRLSRNPDAILSEDTSDWLLTDKATSWPGTPADRGWRYLRQSLERHDSQATNFNYTKTVLETIIGFERDSSPPPWLVQTLEQNHPEWLIRTCLRYEMFETALEQALALVRKTDVELTQNPPQHAMATWLPYTLFDQLLLATAEQEGLSPRAQTLRREVQAEVSNRSTKLQKIDSLPSTDAIMVL